MVKRAFRQSHRLRQLAAFFVAMATEVYMSIQDKFDAALALIGGHNSALGSGPDTPGYVDAQDFILKVKIAGGTSEDRLKNLSHEEILSFLPDYKGVRPVALAKDIARIFREKEELVASSDGYRHVSSKKAEKMSLEELVNSFNPEEPDSPVGSRLKKESRGEPFIVYLQNERIIDVAPTLEMLREIKKGFNGRKTYGSPPREVFPIGVLPDDLVAENPLYPDRPLRPDGTCDQLNRSWAGVPDEVRQFVRIALEKGEVNFASEGGRDRAHAILDICLSQDALSVLRNRYHSVSVEFDKRKKIGTLPILLIALADVKGNLRPFDKGKKVVWTKPFVSPPKKHSGGTYSNNIAFQVPDQQGNLNYYVARDPQKLWVKNNKRTTE